MDCLTKDEHPLKRKTAPSSSTHSESRDALCPAPPDCSPSLPRAPEESALKVLLIEDDPVHSRFIARTLAQTSPGHFTVVTAARLAHGLEHLAQQSFDIVLLDLLLPDGQGLETLAKLRAKQPAVPVVVLTGLDEEATARQAVRNGAQDYLVKGQATGMLIARAIDYAVERARLAKTLERTLRREAEMKEQFLSQVSYELRMPLAVIYQAVANLLTGTAGPLTAQQRECLEIALPNVAQLRKIIDELFDIARSDADKLLMRPERFNLRDLLVRTIEKLQPVAAAKGIRLGLPVCPADLPAAHGDPQHMAEVLLNLIDNALKFTGSGGSVTVEARLTSDLPGFICVGITDSGCGIPIDDQEKIFDRVNQHLQSIESSRKGPAITAVPGKDNAGRPRGRIWVDSKIGRGSTLHFTVPIDVQKK